MKGLICFVFCMLSCGFALADDESDLVLIYKIEKALLTNKKVYLVDADARILPGAKQLGYPKSTSTFYAEGNQIIRDQGLTVAEFQRMKKNHYSEYKKWLAESGRQAELDSLKNEIESLSMEIRLKQSQ